MESDSQNYLSLDIMADSKLPESNIQSSKSMVKRELKPNFIDLSSMDNLYSTEMPENSFSYANKCIICTKDISKDYVKMEKRKPAEKRNLVIRATDDTKNRMMTILMKNKTPLNDTILPRVKPVDLVAVNAGWHKKCFIKMWSKPTYFSSKGRPDDPVVTASMNEVFMYIEESNQKEFTIQELRNVITGYKPNKKTIKNKLIKKYGDRVTLFNSNRYSCIVEIDKDPASSINVDQKRALSVKSNVRRKNKSSNTGSGNKIKCDKTLMMDTEFPDQTDFDDDDLPLHELNERTKKSVDEKNAADANKEEQKDNENKTRTRCCVCLSVDRNVELLGDEEEMYRRICAGIASNEYSKLLLLCFECKALLKNAKRFYRRAVIAQEMLIHTTRDRALKSLSSLSISSPADASVNYNPKVDKENNLDIDICKVETDAPDFINDDFFDENFAHEQTPCFSEVKIEYEAPNLDDIGDDYELRTDRKKRKKKKDVTSVKNVSEFDDSYTSFVDKHGDENSNIKRKSTQKRSLKRTKLEDKIREGKHYKIIVQDFDVDDKIIVEPIERGDVEYWLEKERNSTYFRIQSSKCERCVCGVPRGEDHEKLHHSPENPFVCRICSCTFATDVSLHAHSAAHYYTRACAVCQFRCYDAARMREHVQARHRAAVRCRECGGVFRSVSIFMEHYKNIHKQSICDYCGKRCQHKLFLAQHILSAHVPKVCNICNKRYESTNGLNRHRLLKHVIHRTEAAYCVQCDIQFDNEGLFRQHIYYSRQHRPELSRPPPKPKEKVSLQCPKCPKVYSCRYKLRDHYDLVHANRIKYYCHTCNKAFTRKGHLKDHMRLHEGYKKPKNKFCEICGRGFSTNRILTHHIRTHTGERPHACPHCDAKFAQKVAMVSHVKNVHKKMLTLDSQYQSILALNTT